MSPNVYKLYKSSMNPAFLFEVMEWCWTKVKCTYFKLKELLLHKGEWGSWTKQKRMPQFQDKIIR